MSKPYKAKSLAGAQARVRLLDNRVADWQRIASDLEQDRQRAISERNAMARLAADGPAFDNPLIVYEAKKVRDRVLAEMNMNPDGTYKARAS